MIPTDRPPDVKLALEISTRGFKKKQHFLATNRRKESKGQWSTNNTQEGMCERLSV